MLQKNYKKSGVAILTIVVFLLVIFEAVGRGEYEDQLDLSSGTADATKIQVGSSATTNTAGEVRIPSGTATVSSGTTVSNTGSGYTFSAIEQATVGKTHATGGTNVFFGDDGSLKGDSFEKLEFTTPQAIVTAEGATDVEILSNGDFRIGAADYFRTPEGIVIVNRANIESKGNTLRSLIIKDKKQYSLF